jgi:putative ABC transport system substrate-binding protein
MKRREFIALLGGAAATWPLAANAQSTAQMRLVGVLWGGLTPGTPAANLALATFIKGLHDFGWREGDNLKVEHRWVTSGLEQGKALARELVNLRSDVIVVNSSPLLAALLGESRTIPIVFVRVADPVGQGLITSLSQPGGNVTGFTNFEFSMGGKWLELLKDVAPRTERVAILFNPNTMPYSLFVRSIETASPSFALKIQQSPAQSVSDLERIVSEFAREPNGGLLILPDIFTIEHRQVIIGMAARHTLPAIYPYALFAKDGGLISYGIDAISVYRDATTYVNRILRGEKPADLPVQAPNKFELVVNIKTAKVLGLIVPPALLTSADEVIE